MTALDAALKRVVTVGNVVSMAALVVMALLTIVDVAGRYLLNRPLLGALELSEIMLVLMVFGCFAYTERRNQHIDIDVVVTRFSPRGQALAEAFAALLSTAIWGMIAWQTGIRALDVHRAGETTANLALRVGPLIWIAAAGSALFALALALRMLRALGRVARS